MIRLVLLLFLTQGLWSAPLSAAPVRTALVVGVSQYDHGPGLPNAASDAQKVALRLHELGYRTQLLANPDRMQMLKALAHLRLESAEATQTIIYFSGHGASLGDESYLFLRDTRMRADQLETSALPLRVLIRAVSDKPRQKILLLDACRDNPVSISANIAVTSPSAAPAGLFIGYAAQPGQIAYDGAGRSSPFTGALLRQLAGPPRPIEDMMRALRLAVIQQTQGRQIPWSRSSLLSRAFLGKPPQPADQTAQTAHP